MNEETSRIVQNLLDDLVVSVEENVTGFKIW